MGHDIRKTQDPQPPRTGSGDGAADRTGYGAGGLGAGGDRREGPPQSWDAPGVSPAGERTGSSTDGPRVPMDGEADPDDEASDEA